MREVARGLLDPEPDRVPGPAQQAGLRHVVQRLQTEFREGLVGQTDLQRTHGLPLRERRDQRLRAHDAGLDLGRAAGLLEGAKMAMCDGGWTPVIGGIKRKARALKRSLKQ